MRGAIDEVEVLQKSLIVVRGRVAARILEVVNTWHRLLTVEYQTLQAQAKEAREIPNPFVYGNPVAETAYNVFTGREDIRQHIEESILGATQVPTLLLQGPRRMGKSSILKQLPRMLGLSFAPVEVDCQNPAMTESLLMLLRYLSRAMSDGLQCRQIQIEPLAREALAHEPFTAFDEWLDRVEQALPESMRLLLCLDEYEYLQHTLEAGWGIALLDALRHTLQHRPRLVLMFTGAHTFAELGPAWTGRFINARRIRVSFLTYDEVLPLLTRPIPNFDMTYAPGALKALYTATHGQPFLTQALAFELVQYLNEQRHTEATLEAVEVAITRALQAGDSYFANVWNDVGSEGQAILRALVCGETLPDIPEALSWLREHDVLNDAGTFAVPMVERWVREHIVKG